MGVVADGYDRLRAVGVSADRSVTITLTGRGEVEVALAAPAAFAEATLARQVAGAARVALAAYRREQKALITDTVKGLGGDAGDGRPPGALERFRSELDGSPVRGVSPRGDVEVRRDGHGEIEVTVRAGTVGRLSHARLAEEVRAALAAAVADYGRISDRLFERWVGAPADD